ncbi:hypothetical protein QFC19_003967 [Naganishia cerealis]|uniref:Uncharacterized protein n=1 Tax=Naganishia cerealis TaxID=610337 RepID=A0ACC2W101_9TREE|nr:hypothetical protein QFC19_003967 [Naganishia cerealis]
MHFIGNNSLTLHHPREAELHIIPLFLTYDPAWTVLSLVVSCAVTILAFFVMGLEGDYVQDFFRKIGFVRWKQEDESASDEDDEDTQEARSAVVVTDLSVKEKKPPSKTLSWGNNAVHRQEAKMMDKSYDPSLRRASIAAIQPDIMREHFKPATVLSRIQSLPENYIDDSLIKGVPMEPIDGRTRSEQEHDMEGAIANIRRRISQTSQNSKENNPSKDEYVPSSRDSPDSSESSGRVRKRRHVRRRRMDDSGRTSKIKRHLGLDVVTMEDVMKIIISGAIAGIGIAGMRKFSSTNLFISKAKHSTAIDYIGQISINNIGIIRYRLITIVLSVLIACVAVIAGLYIMFIILRPKLKHGWVTKVGVACVLAAAVCAMHYTGMSGEQQELPEANAHR